MPVVINGTTGISGVNGSAGTPAVQGSDTNTGMFFPAADTIAFAEGGVEVARFDSSGNLGLGVTPSAWAYGGNLQIKGGSAVSFASQYGGIYANAYDNGGFKYISNAPANSIGFNNGQIEFKVAPSGTAGNAISFTQAMTLDASGNLLVGKTSEGTGNNGFQALQSGVFASTVSFGSTGGENLILSRQTNTGNLATFVYGSSIVGSISTNGTSTAYNTSSDYRLKENIAPMTGALAKVAALKPCTYKWKADGSDGEGFIAHELQAVVPQCVTGEKDAVDAEGNPVYQGIDTSFLVATLTAAIQELKAIVDQQAIEIANLKGQA